MKKQSFLYPALFTLGLASFQLLSPTAFAQTSRPLVTITGNLDPVYSVKISDQDLAQIAAGLNSIESMQALTVDVNTIYSDKDKAAFELASQEVSRIIIEATKHLVDMRAIVYKLNIDLQRDKENRFTQQIYEAYQEHFQRAFTALVETFLGPKGSMVTALGDSMERCYTTSCLQDIASAQADMLDFGKAINQRIDLSSTRTLESSFRGFKSQIVKDAVQKTVDSLLNTNQKSSLYVQVLRTAAVPFVSAARGSITSIAELGRVIASPTLSRFKIYAEPIEKKNREWKTAQEQFEVRVGENYKTIIANGNGANNYQEESDGNNVETMSTGVSTISADPQLFKALSTLNNQLEDLQKATIIDKQEVASMIGSTLLQVAESKWVFSTFLKTMAMAKNAGITVVKNCSGGNYYNNLVKLNIAYCSENEPDVTDSRESNSVNAYPVVSVSGVTLYSTGVRKYQTYEMTLFAPFYSKLTSSYFIIATKIDIESFIKEVNGRYLINFSAKTPQSGLITKAK